MQTFREFMNTGSFGNTATRNIDQQTFGSGHSNAVSPSPTLDLPTRVVEGRIRKLIYTSNPITAVLEDGTMWKITKKQWEYLKSIDREPKENRRVQLELFLDGTIKSVNVLG
jgi:hypothetical protein